MGFVNNARDPLEKHKSHKNALLKKKEKKMQMLFQHYPNEY